MRAMQRGGGCRGGTNCRFTFRVQAEGAICLPYWCQPSFSRAFAFCPSIVPFAIGGVNGWGPPRGAAG